MADFFQVKTEKAIPGQVKEIAPEEAMCNGVIGNRAQRYRRLGQTGDSCDGISSLGCGFGGELVVVSIHECDCVILSGIRLTD